MKSWKRFQTMTAILASWALVFPPVCLQAQQAAQATLVRDVELNSDGAMRGQVVTSQGQPVAYAPVIVQQNGKVLTNTRTYEDGTFAVRSLRGGVYQLTAADQTSQVRVWTHHTAPPSASEGVMVVTGDVLRGQGCTDGSCTGTCGGSCGACGVAGGPLSILMNPFVIGAAVAAAIAIPLALDDDDNDNAS